MSRIIIHTRIRHLGSAGGFNAPSINKRTVVNNVGAANAHVQAFSLVDTVESSVDLDTLISSLVSYVAVVNKSTTETVRIGFATGVYVAKIVPGDLFLFRADDATSLPTLFLVYDGAAPLVEVEVALYPIS